MLASLEKVTKVKQRIYDRLSQHILFKIQQIDPNSIEERLRFRYKNHSIEDFQSILDTPATIVLKKWGDRNPIFYNYNSSDLNSLSEKFRVFKGYPKIKSFKDVIYTPQYHCLYSSDGLRIDYSCLYRGSQRTELVTKAPDKIEPPKELKRISQKFIYAGNITGPYGHFLTESIARLWYVIKDERYPVICHGLTQRNSFKRVFIDFFRAVNLDPCRFIFFKKTVLLQEVIIPYPSFSNRCEAFEAHKLLPENVAKSLLPEKLKMTSQPLYFTRRFLNPNLRLIVNESKLEKELYKSNFAIYSPEKLSLKQQIYLINKHEVIIGSIGSALHNILFDISPKKNLVCFGNQKYINTNYLIIDAIKSINSVYISALKKDLNCSKTKSHQNKILDLDIAIDGLKNLGLI